MFKSLTGNSSPEPSSLDGGANMSFCLGKSCHCSKKRCALKCHKKAGRFEFLRRNMEYSPYSKCTAKSGANSRVSEKAEL